MNRSQNVTLATAAAVITALLLFGVLIYTVRSGNTNPDINLPPDPSELHMPSSSPDDTVDINPLAPNLIDITPENVTKIVEDLSRPSDYTATNKTTRFWDGGESAETYKVYVNGKYSCIKKYGADSKEISTIIFTPTMVYMPLGGQEQPVAKGGFTPDAAMAMPTYEDVVNLEEITGAGYAALNARPCVWVKTRDGQGYEIEYWVDLENGLLVYAEAYQNGAPAWKFEQSELTLGKPDESVFRLQSGESALTKE